MGSSRWFFMSSSGVVAYAPLIVTSPCRVPAGGSKSFKRRMEQRRGQAMEDLDDDNAVDLEAADFVPQSKRGGAGSSSGSPPRGGSGSASSGKASGVDDNDGDPPPRRTPSKGGRAARPVADSDSETDL